MVFDPKDRPSFGNSITPMDDRGEAIDEAGVRRMLRYMSDGGTCVFVGGPHATEFVNLDPKERRRVWEVAVDELGGKAPINAIPFGPASTTEMIARFKLAKDMGFDGAQLYPGAQDGHGNDGLFIAEAERYFCDILDSIDFPIWLCGYHGAEIIDAPDKRVPHEMLIRLVRDYPHIKGVTTMTCDLGIVKDLTTELKGRCPLRLAGALDWFAMMELGVYGFHSIQQSIAPKLCSSFMEAFHTGDKACAKTLSAKIKRLNEIVHGRDRYYPRSLKHALNHLGLDVGSIRKPYIGLPEKTVQEMATDLDALDLGAIETLPRKSA